MSQKATLSLVLSLTLILYFVSKIPQKAQQCSNLVFIRQIETNDKSGQVFIHDHNSPLIVIGGMAPFAEQDIIADIIETHPEIKECKNRTIAISQMLGRSGVMSSIFQFWTRTSNNGNNRANNEDLVNSENKMAYDALLENGVLKVYESALSIYLLEILTKQGKTKSRILCSRESELLIYGKEIKQIFPNSKFIHVFMEKEMMAQGLVGQNEVLAKIMIESAKVANETCLHLGKKNCLQISVQDWKNSKKTIEDVFNFIFQ